MALMAAAGEITPMPTAAIFADTQAEPKSVYTWLDWLEKQLPFPVHRVTKGDLTAEALRLRGKKDGGIYSKSVIPAFIKNPDGSRGMMQRVCTYDYKMLQLIKKQRELAQIKRGQKIVGVICWIGISWDERLRMKPSREPWAQHRFPLVDAEITRNACLAWIQAHGFPTPPRSACVYCPFHSDVEWERLRLVEPEEFQRAIEFEKDLQATKAQTDNIGGIPFLHSSLIPLSQVDFANERQGRLWIGECEGLCGV